MNHERIDTLARNLREHASMARWQANTLHGLRGAVQEGSKAASLEAAISNLMRMAMRLDDSAEYVQQMAAKAE